ncbi:MAG: RNA polymerase sporulation sigma factor SigK [Clostridia bacterium]|nr:RNA polymerase sporulation sigma factor SigK [Clostridia bacterium]
MPMFPLSALFQECLFFLGYITGKSEFPKQLPRAEEEALIVRMAEGDDNARQTLITHNLRLVSHIARKYTVPGYGPDDLISIGVIGLVKAVNSYKPQSGTALGTYAARCIENEILMTLRASRKYRGDVFLQDSVGTDGEGNDITYMDILGTDPEDLENAVIRRVTLDKVQSVLSGLPARERLVLELRYGLTDGRQHPQHEIAKLLGISRSYVSRVEKKAVTLLRAAIGEDGR